MKHNPYVCAQYLDQQTIRNKTISTIYLISEQKATKGVFTDSTQENEPPVISLGPLWSK